MIESTWESREKKAALVTFVANISLQQTNSNTFITLGN